MIKPVVSALTIQALLMLMAASSTAAATAVDPCEQLWRTESASVGKTPEGHAALLTKWISLRSGECGNTPTYAARLANAYALNGKYDEARSVLQPFLGKSSGAAYLVDFAQFTIDYLEGLKAGKSSADNLPRLEAAAQAYVHKYPDFADGYALLGSLQTMRDRHVEAIASLEKAVHSEMDLGGTYRNLAISYAEVGRYGDSIKASDAAVQLNESLTGDQYFIYAVAKANAGSGDFPNAELALRAIAAKKPEVRNDPDFKRAVDFVLAKEAEAKKDTAESVRLPRVGYHGEAIDPQEYHGALANGIPNGHGVALWKNGIRYEGEWNNGHFEGQGALTLPDGAIHSGHWVNGVQDGKATHTLPDGSKYEGDFKNDRKTGQGTATYPSGEKYVGGWLDDKRHGFGIVTLATGSRYEGQWLSGKITGKGKMTLPNGKAFEGNFLEGSPQGDGICTSLQDPSPKPCRM